MCQQTEKNVKYLSRITIKKVIFKTTTNNKKNEY